MGNQCLSTNIFYSYTSQLNKISVLQLKNQWSTIASYKIKRIFQRLSQRQQSKHQRYLTLPAFCQIFPELIRYQDTQKQRIYKIFDRSHNSFVNWIDFYDMISICYFADQQILATILFMIFDEYLQKKLTNQQLTLLFQLNAIFLRQHNNQLSLQNSQQQQILKLLNNQQTITLQKWLDKSTYYFDYNQFRRLFNIFKQQKMQKQLVNNFYNWNQLYDEEQNKYVSYILSFKWFQTWKAYVENQYGIIFNIEDKNPTTLKSIRTKKSLKTNNQKSKKHITQHFSSALKLKLENLQENDSIIDNKIKNFDQVKNFDMIRCNIGERPKYIYNKFLEGEYAGTIKTDIVENRDYVLVSEKVWNYLTEIYSGEPQFRRTGFEQIELSPKIIRIYSGMFNNQINYSSQIVREAPTTTKIQDIITKLLQIDKQQFNRLSIFYRTFNMSLWQQIIDNNINLIQLTSHTIILLAYLQKKTTSQKIFRLKYLKSPKTIKQCNLGDTLIYQNTINKIQKQVLFYNRTIQGKYIIHFIGQSYTNDLCLEQKQFYKCCKIRSIPQPLFESISKNCKFYNRKLGIQGSKNLSFIISIVLQFLENFNLKQTLVLLPTANPTKQTNINQLQSNQILPTKQKQQKKTYLSVILAYISRLLKANMHVDLRDIIIMVDLFFPQFRNFGIIQINQFIDTFCEKLKQDAAYFKFPNMIAEDFQFSICSKIKCLRCGCNNVEVLDKQNLLTVTIPQPSEAYYQVIMVPFCINMFNSSIKRYGFQLPRNSTLKDYKSKLASVAHLEDKNYILLEIQGNTIIKNYNYIKDNTLTLDNLHLRQDDNIYAFQVCIDFRVFVQNHFSFSQSDHSQIQQKDLKVGDMIDCRSPEKGWIFGKIVEKNIMPYTYQQNIKVLHKIKNMDQSLYTYKIIKNIVAFFPSESYKNSQQYHLKLIQRVFSEANNQMVVCNMPFVIVLPSWMRPKQFQYLVYLQIQRFIGVNHSFQSEQYTSNLLGSSSIQNNLIRQSTKKKVKKFKQYLYGKNLPYKLNFIDQSGHCLICFKFVKSNIFKGQSQNYCDGCSLKQDEPVSWQITINDLVIAVDWRNIWCFKKDLIKNDSSYLSLSIKRRKDIETIQSCLEKVFKQSTQTLELLCCNMPVKALVTKFVTSLPNFLIVSLDRIVQQNGFKKKIRRPVYLGDQNIIVQGQQYKLVGVIGSKGHQNNIIYTNYIKQFCEGQVTRWLSYNGQLVQIIKKQQIDKNCTHVFFYQKTYKTQKLLQAQKMFPTLQQLQHKQLNQKTLIRHSCKKQNDSVQKIDKKLQNQSNKQIKKCIIQQQFSNLQYQDQVKLIRQNYNENDSNFQKKVRINIDLLKIPDDDFNHSQKNITL